MNLSFNLTNTARIYLYIFKYTFYCWIILDLWKSYKDSTEFSCITHSVIIYKFSCLTQSIFVKTNKLTLPQDYWGFPHRSNQPSMQETQVQFLNQEDPLEKERATHSSIIAWRIPWTEEPGGLQSMRSQESDTTEWLSTQHAHKFSSVQSLSHVRLFATPWTTVRQASQSITNSWSPPKPMSIVSVMPSNNLLLCHPLLLLPSIFPTIRVFSNESALLIRWSKYWSFSFNISPSNEHPGLISFRMDW